MHSLFFIVTYSCVVQHLRYYAVNCVTLLPGITTNKLKFIYYNAESTYAGIPSNYLQPKLHTLVRFVITIALFNNCIVRYN